MKEREIDKNGKRISGKTYNLDAIAKIMKDRGIENESGFLDLIGVGESLLATHRYQRKMGKYSEATEIKTAKLSNALAVSSEDILEDIPKNKESVVIKPAEQFGEREKCFRDLEERISDLESFVMIQYKAISCMFERIESALNEDALKKIFKDSFGEL